MSEGLGVCRVCDVQLECISSEIYHFSSLESKLLFQSCETHLK